MKAKRAPCGLFTHQQTDEIDSEISSGLAGMRNIYIYIVFSRGHATLRFAVSVRPSLRHLVELLAFFA